MAVNIKIMNLWVMKLRSVVARHLFTRLHNASSHELCKLLSKVILLIFQRSTTCQIW
jgi:hypothetical protein